MEPIEPAWPEADIPNELAALLLSVLDGGPDARMVLADWFEERGHAQAEWLREHAVWQLPENEASVTADRVEQRSAFVLVLAMLPRPHQQLLACAFIERLLTRWETENPTDFRPRQLLNAIRKTVDRGTPLRNVPDDRFELGTTRLAVAMTYSLRAAAGRVRRLRSEQETPPSCAVVAATVVLGDAATRPAGADGRSPAEGESETQDEILRTFLERRATRAS